MRSSSAGAQTVEAVPAARTTVDRMTDTTRVDRPGIPTRRVHRGTVLPIARRQNASPSIRASDRRRSGNRTQRRQLLATARLLVTYRTTRSLWYLLSRRMRLKFLRRPGPPQLSVGLSMLSITSTSTGPLADSSLRPSCSVRAVKMDGPPGSAMVCSPIAAPLCVIC